MKTVPFGSKVLRRKTNGAYKVRNQVPHTAPPEPAWTSSITSSKVTDFDCDVAIVGGGIVGATLAAALKDSGLSAIVIELLSSEVAAVKSQAYALSPISSRIFARIGVWEQILPYVGKYRQIHLSDAEEPEIVKFKTVDLGTEFLGYVAEHKTLLQSLQEYISKCANISCLYSAKTCGVTYQRESAVVEVDGRKQKLRTKLVVGADGARSLIRNWAGIKTRGWQYWQSCVTFTVTHQASRNDIAFERFWPDGPMGVLPLPGNRCRIVWTAPHAEAQALQKLEEEEFLTKLEYYTGGLLGKLKLTSDRLLFPVQLFQSRNYVQSRLALIGDAAHRCHPLGGQGLNLGIKDAAALAQVLSEAHQRGEDIGDVQVLKRYERWRKSENVIILGFTDLLDRLFSNNWLPAIILRRFGLWLLRSLPSFKIFALKLMTGFQGRIPQLGSVN
jgi:2-octaprenyl-6-methoxyphenol hydroxylase